MRFILASTSPYRNQLLTRAGFTFLAQAPKVDEEALKKEAPKDPSQFTSFLAQKKAESLLADFPNDWILGCDQVATLDKQILGKPGSRETAIKQLTQMSGRSHLLITAMAFCKQNHQPHVIIDRTEIFFRTLSLDEIKAYVDFDQSLDCAGGYKFEKAGPLLMEKIVSNDPTSIEGLSLMAVTSFFRQLGISLDRMLSKGS